MRGLLQRHHWGLALLSLPVVASVVLLVGYLILRGLGAGEEAVEYLLSARTLTIVDNNLTLTITVTVAAATLKIPFA